MVEDSTVEEYVKAKVEELVGEGESFTAYDVTLKVRKDHPGEEIAHSVVRIAVHDLFETGDSLMDDYTRYHDNTIPGGPFRYDVAEPVDGGNGSDPDGLTIGPVG
jgi:hypothetical protein